MNISDSITIQSRHNAPLGKLCLTVLVDVGRNRIVPSHHGCSNVRWTPGMCGCFELKTRRVQDVVTDHRWPRPTMTGNTVMYGYHTEYSTVLSYVAYEVGRREWSLAWPTDCYSIRMLACRTQQRALLAAGPRAAVLKIPWLINLRVE